MVAITRLPHRQCPCAAAQSITQLIVFRALAGAFGGGIVSLVMVIVGDVVSLRERGTYQGVLGVVVALSNAGGPLIGGGLASVGWAVVLHPRRAHCDCLAFIMVIFLLPLKKVEGSVKSKLAKIDYLGTALVLSGSVCCSSDSTGAVSSIHGRVQRVGLLILGIVSLLSLPSSRHVWLPSR